MDKPNKDNEIGEQKFIDRKCMEMCDRQNAKLKEAEKTIANKDVIIQMLQEQVKKLETSYKQNLEQTEMFRYKFLVVSDQMNRMNGIQKSCDSDKRNCEKENVTPKCKCPQYVKNVEKHLQDHNELLQTLLAKISEKTEASTNDDNLKAEYLERINQLEEEIRTLKKKDEIEVSKDDSHEIITAKDSLLDAYKRTNMELHKRMSIMLGETALVNNTDTNSEELSLVHRNTSVSFHKVSSIPVEEKEEEISQINTTNSEEEKFAETPAPDQKPNICSCFVTTEILDKVNKLVQKLYDVGDKVNACMDTQTSTQKDIDSLRRELNNINNASEDYSRLSERLEEHKEVVLDQFRDNKQATDDLRQMNEEIKSELNELTNKVDAIYQNLDALPPRANAEPRNSDPKLVGIIDIPTVTKDAEKPVEATPVEATTEEAPTEEAPTEEAPTEEATTAEESIHSGPPTSNEDEETHPAEPQNDPQENFSNLEEVSQLKDQQLKNIRTLTCFYTLILKTLKNDYQASPKSQDDIRSCIDRVRDENLKLKTTISAVIDRLKTASDQECETPETVLYCSCDMSSTESNCRCGVNESVKTDIEDIYNVVRRTFTSQSKPPTSSSSVCMCHKINTKLCDDKDACHNKENTPETFVVFEKCQETQSVSKNIPQVECVGEIIQISSDHSSCSHCKNDNLISSLQQYLNYLNEQLDTITVIETRIEDLKSNIKHQ